MKNYFLLSSFVCASLLLTACGASKNESKRAQSVENAKAKNAPLILEGVYDMTLACADQGAQSKVPKIKMVFTFKKDGTYSEDVEILEQDCSEHCSLVVEGTYAATQSQLTINQKKISSKDGTQSDSDAKSHTMIIQGRDKEKGHLVLIDSGTDNACEGRMFLKLNKK